MSHQFDLDCGVPQGLCLGPLLFVIYALNLFKIVEKKNKINGLINETENAYINLCSFIRTS